VFYCSFALLLLFEIEYSRRGKASSDYNNKFENGTKIHRERIKRARYSPTDVESSSLFLGCGPQLQRPNLPTELVERERELQKEMALKLDMDRSEQLFRISSAMRLKGVDLCGESVEPFIGALWLDLEAFPEDSRTIAGRIFGLGEELRVRYLISDFPAEAAGMKVGDEILNIGEVHLEPPDSWGDQTSRLQRANDALINHGTKPINIGLQRGDKKLTLTVKPELACRFPIKLVNDDKVNAFTDGDQIVITTGMVRFVKDNNELAGVLSHELAHNILGHINKMLGNQIIGGALGFLLDIGIAAAGVNTLGAFTKLGAKAGARVYSQEFEMEADYLALYIAARSGFDISKAPDLFRRMGVENPESIKENYFASHPSTPERAVSMEKAIEEIQEKLKARQALVPEKREFQSKEVDEDSTSVGE